VVREREIGKMVGPVGEMEREILVSVSPVVSDTLVALNDEGSHAKGLESSGNVKTTDKGLADGPSSGRNGNSPVTATDHDYLGLDALQTVILNSLVVPRLVSDHMTILIGDLRITF
jgi:hypothetical protein